MLKTIRELISLVFVIPGFIIFIIGIAISDIDTANELMDITHKFFRNKNEGRANDRR